MKRLLIVLAVSAVLILGLAACGSESSSNDNGAAGNTVKITVSIDFPDDSDAKDVDSQEIEVADGTALLDVMTENFDVKTASYSGGEGIDSIGGVAQDGSAGWVYTVNDEVIMDYPDAYKVKDGDAVQWTYASM